MIVRVFRWILVPQSIVRKAMVSFLDPYQIRAIRLSSEESQRVVKSLKLVSKISTGRQDVVGPRIQGLDTRSCRFILQSEI